MQRRAIIRFGFALLLGVPVLLATLFFLTIATERGSRWLVHTALQAANGVSIGAFSGRLWDSFALSELMVETGPLSARVDRLSVTWQVRSLTEPALVIEAATLQGVEVTVAAPSASSKARSPVALPAPPLPLEVKDFHIHELLVNAEDHDIAIDHLGLAVAWDKHQFRLNDFELRAYDHRFSAHARVTVGQSPQLTATAAWTGNLGGEPGQASLSVNGPLDELQFDTRIEALFSATLNGRIDALAEVPSLTVHGRIEPYELGEGVSASTTTIDVAGTLVALNLELATQLRTPATGEVALTLASQLTLPSDTATAIAADISWRAEPRKVDFEALTGSGRVRYEDNVVLLAHATAVPYQTRLSGEVELQLPDPILDLALNWEDIDYRLTNATTLSTRSGSLHAQGALSDLAVELASKLDIPRVGRVDASGTARVHERHVSIPRLTAALLGGEITASGALDFVTGVDANVEFSGRDIDLSAIDAAMPGRINFAGNGRLSRSEEGISSELVLSHVSGAVSGHALAGDARLVTEPGHVALERAHLTAGASRVDVYGTWAEQITGAFDVHVEDFSAFYAGAEGSITGAGTFTGEPTLPRIKADLSGKRLRIKQFKAAELAADLDIDMSRDTESRAELVIEDLEIDAEKIGRVAVKGQGKPAAHRLVVDLEGGPIVAQAAAHGRLVEGHGWQGHLDTFEVSADIMGAWSLTSPSAVRITATEASLARACLSADAALACLSGDYRQAGSTAHIQLTSIPLALANHYLPAAIRLRGLSNGSIELHTRQNVITGRGRVQVRDGVIERKSGDDHIDKSEIQSLAVDFDLDPANVRVTAAAEVERWFTLNGNLTSTRNAEGVITADVEGHCDDISWLTEFVPALSGSTGRLELSAAVATEGKRPVGEARANLVDGSLLIPDIGLEVTTLETRISGDAHTLMVNTTIGATEGDVAVTGQVSVEDDGGWHYDLQLEGENFPLVRTPEVEADITPNLQLRGNMTTLAVTGSLSLARVLVELKGLPESAVSLSEDEVIVAANRDVVPENKRGSFLTDALCGEVDVVLGGDVTVNGFGLAADLSGQVQWTKRRGETLGRANGAIVIDEGVFRSYGQRLQIENGRLQFAGPVDNPGLALRAIRPELPVTAGVIATGTVRSPKITLFSEPALTDGDILSYIVTGRALGETSEGDAALLNQAALSLGANESAAVTNEIRDAFGLDEFSVATGASARETSLIAGKRLSPRLSVRTGFNPFDQLWSFFLNYKLTEHWSVEAESGEYQGADILYSIERERLFERGGSE